MPDLKLVLGPSSALEDALAGAIVTAKGGDPLAPVTVLVGGTLLKRYLPRMLARRGLAHINIRFERPDELATRLAGEGRRQPRPTLAVERLLADISAESAGAYFGRLPRGDGFSDALLRLLRELERGGFDPETLVQAFADSGLRGEKSDDIVAMFRTFVERHELAGLASMSAAYASADAGDLDGPLLVYGLREPAATARSLIARVASTQAVTYFLPSYGEEVDGAHEATRAWLASLGAMESQVGAPDGVGEVLGARAFGGGRVPEQDGTSVRMTSAPDSVREVWEAARACLRWAAEGIAFHEMAVVYRNRDPYHALCEEVFAEAGIDTYLHDGSLLAAHPSGRRLLSLLELAADGSFSRQRVMEFLAETRIPRATRDRHPNIRPARWESYSREAGVVEGVEQWRARLTRLAGEKRERARDERFQWLASQATQVEELLAFVEELHADVAARPERAAWSEYLAYAQGLAERYADGLKPILEALSELEQLSVVQVETTFAGFVRAVRKDLETRDATRVLGRPVREFGKRGVAVLDASSVQGLRFRAVCLVGISERAWPPPPRPDPLLLEQERAALNTVAPPGCGLPQRTTPDVEPLSFVHALAAGTERVALSYARAEAGGSGKHLPSYFFRAVVEAITGRTLSIDDVDSAACVTRLRAARLTHEPQDESLSAAEYDRGIIAAAIAGRARGALEVLAHFDAGNPLRPERALVRAVEARRQRWSDRLTAFDGVMLSEEALARAAAIDFGREKAVSPSRLEMFAECPYRYFLRYVLGVEPVEEPDAIERLGHLERGSLIHAILERFLKQLGPDDLPRAASRERHLVVLREVVEAEAKDREERGVTGRPLLWELDKRKIVEDLARWYDDECMDQAGLAPRAFEAGFGGARYGYGEEDPITSSDPVDVAFDGRILRLQGRIDRIDWDEGRTRFRVIDYKTGKTKPRKEARFEGGRSMQLAVYLHAAAHLTGIDILQGSAEYYYCTSAGGFDRRGMTGPELEALRADFDRVLATVTRGVESGYFAMNPGKGDSNCLFCDYKSLCDARRGALCSKKSGDPRGAAFIDLGSIA